MKNKNIFFLVILVWLLLAGLQLVRGAITGELSIKPSDPQANKDGTIRGEVYVELMVNANDNFIPRIPTSDELDNTVPGGGPVTVEDEIEATVDQAILLDEGGPVGRRTILAVAVFLATMMLIAAFISRGKSSKKK